MQPRMKNFLFLALAILVIASITLSSCLMSEAEDDTYLTPIPESTWSAYDRSRSISNKFDAVLAANQEIHYSRMKFTQGEPKVVYAEKIKINDIRERLHIKIEVSGDFEVWLVIFEGKWQILPPVSNELLPLESGCIHVTLPANEHGSTELGAGDCTQLP